MKNTIVRPIAVLALVLVALFSSAIANAQSTGLAINPRLDLTVQAGKTTSGSLYVDNLNKDVPTTVTLNVVDFKAMGETGSPSLELKPDAPQTAWSLKPFIKLPKTVDLAPGESKYVPFTISIPANQGAGSYYSAIKYDPRASSDDESVLITGAPTQLVFVTVPGKTTELMNLKEFGPYVKGGNDNGEYKSLFVSSQPNRLAYLLQNVGNVAENPNGSIIIKNIFGKQVKLIESANPKKNLALLGQTRRFEVCIQEPKDQKSRDAEKCDSPKLMPGMYRAQLSLFYGINGSDTQEISDTATFWYMPLWFVGIILLFLAVLTFVIVKVRNSLIGTTSHRRGNKGGGRKFPFTVKR